MPSSYTTRCCRANEAPWKRFLSRRLAREPRRRLGAADQRQESRHLGPVLTRGEGEAQRMEQRAALAAAGDRQRGRPGLPGLLGPWLGGQGLGGIGEEGRFLDLGFD